MLVIYARPPLPDMPYWYGRRLLAAMDAVVWPVAWVVLFGYVPKPVGVVGPMVTALAVLFGIRRLHRAIWVNHRYRFTTWRWGRVALAMWLMGLVMKLSLHA